MTKINYFGALRFFGILCLFLPQMTLAVDPDWEAWQAGFASHHPAGVLQPMGQGYVAPPEMYYGPGIVPFAPTVAVGGLVPPEAPAPPFVSLDRTAAVGESIAIGQAYFNQVQQAEQMQQMAQAQQMEQARQIAQERQMAQMQQMAQAQQMMADPLSNQPMYGSPAYGPGYDSPAPYFVALLEAAVSPLGEQAMMAVNNGAYKNKKRYQWNHDVNGSCLIGQSAQDVAKVARAREIILLIHHQMQETPGNWDAVWVYRKELFDLSNHGTDINVRALLQSLASEKYTPYKSPHNFWSRQLRFFNLLNDACLDEAFQFWSAVQNYRSKKLVEKFGVVAPSRQDYYQFLFELEYPEELVFEGMYLASEKGMCVATLLANELPSAKLTRHLFVHISTMPQDAKARYEAYLQKRTDA